MIDGLLVHIPRLFSVAAVAAAPIIIKDKTLVPRDVYLECIMMYARMNCRQLTCEMHWYRRCIAGGDGGDGTIGLSSLDTALLIQLATHAVSTNDELLRELLSELCTRTGRDDDIVSIIEGMKLDVPSLSRALLSSPSKPIRDALFQKGASLSTDDPEYVYHAAGVGDVMAVVRALDGGMSVDATSSLGVTLIQCAAEAGDMDTVELLLSRNASFNEMTYRAGLNRNHLDVCRRLVSSKTLIWLSNIWTAVHTIDAADCLMSHGAHTDGAIRDLARNNHFEIIRYLVETVHIPMPDDVLPYIASDKSNLNLLDYLIAHGAQIDAKDDSDATALCNAIILAPYFIERGADVNTRDGQGQTPLHIACQSDSVDIVTMILDAGADVTTCDEDDNAPLHSACDSSSDEAPAIVQVLLARGAGVSPRSADGNTALHLAVQTGNVKVVDALIHAGADVNARNEDDETPLQLADGDEIQEMLKAAGASD